MGGRRRWAEEGARTERLRGAPAGARGARAALWVQGAPAVRHRRRRRGGRVLRHVFAPTWRTCPTQRPPPGTCGSPRPAPLPCAGDPAWAGRARPRPGGRARRAPQLRPRCAGRALRRTLAPELAAAASRAAGPWRPRSPSAPRGRPPPGAWLAAAGPRSGTTRRPR